MTNTISNIAPRRAIVVLGMHRSGTSALTGSLENWGCKAAETQIKPNAENPRGFFESRPIARLNDSLLEEGNSSWDDWRPLSKECLLTLQSQARVEQAQALVQQEFGDAPLIALKDPRICRLVPFWDQTLTSMGITPFFILALRHPLEVAQSLQKRNGFDLSLGVMLWIDHVLGAEFATRGKPRCFTGFEQLLADPAREKRRISEHLDLRFPTLPDQTSPETDGFLNTNLRHFGPDSATNSGHNLPVLVQNIFDIINRWALQEETAADYAALDKLSARHKDVCAAASAQTSHRAVYEAFFQLSGHKSAELSQKLSQTKLPNEDLSDLVKTLTHVNTVLQQQSTRFRQSQDEVQSKLVEVQQERSELMQRVEQTETRLRENIHKMERDADSADELINDLHALVARVENARKSLETENAELHALVAQVETARHAIASSKFWRLTAPLRKAVNLIR